MRWKVKWVVLWSLWAARLVRQPSLPVLVSNGWVRGSIAGSGRYVQYSGIPYATVVERFQAPGPEPKWDGVFEAVREDIHCIQMKRPYAEATEHSSFTTIGRKDCLILNIYTPFKPMGPLPVMVFIHGGAFHEGSAMKMGYGPEYLVRKNIILVSINYRLGAPGFLCLKIKEAPGNLGMKDQVAALRWIQKNIKAFGGDPDNVTIFGESAGSASVSLHVLAPMSKGLFRKTIQQSGSSLSSWAIQHDPLNIAFLKARAVGYDGTSTDPYDLLNFFKSKTDVEIFTHLTKLVHGNIAQSRAIFTPCIENNIDGEETFLTELPAKLLKEGRYNKVPMIIGSNSAEGIMFLSLEHDKHMANLTMDVVLPKDLRYPNAETKRKITDEVTKLYMGDDRISIETKKKLVPFYGEPFFNFPTIQEADLIAKTNPHSVFNYLFKYHGWRNFCKHVSPPIFWGIPGATHADELFYLFSQDIIPSLFENKMIELMTTMWTNFAKYGDPTPHESPHLPIRWPPIKPEDQRSMVIDKDLTLGPMWFNNTTLTYWKKIFEKYRIRD